VYRGATSIEDETWRPNADEGAHPSAPGSGWDDSWNSFLWTSETEVSDELITNEACGDLAYVNWTATPANDRSEAMPMNCVPWFMAMAFCIWDGGRLPSETEWNFAATGGEEQNKYPWGDTPVPDDTFAVIGCNPTGGCVGDAMEPPGSREQSGAGEFGHADLAGNVIEWTLDQRILSDANHDPLPDQSYDQQSCNDCVDLSDAGNMDFHRVSRGGAWFVHSPQHDIPEVLRISQRGSLPGLVPDSGVGIRCARDVQ
jgi:sulfatase modifying factor 1